MVYSWDEEAKHDRQGRVGDGHDPISDGGEAVPADGGEYSHAMSILALALCVL